MLALDAVLSATRSSERSNVTACWAKQLEVADRPDAQSGKNFHDTTRVAPRRRPTVRTILPWILGVVPTAQGVCYGQGNAKWLAVDVVGDVDGDGVQDVVVAIPQRASDDSSRPPRTIVVSGQTGKPVAELPAIAGCYVGSADSTRVHPTCVFTYDAITRSVRTTAVPELVACDLPTRNLKLLPHKDLLRLVEIHHPFGANQTACAMVFADPAVGAAGVTQCVIEDPMDSGRTLVDLGALRSVAPRGPQLLRYRAPCMETEDLIVACDDWVGLFGLSTMRWSWKTSTCGVGEFSPECVTAVADINGDGVADLAFGAPSWRDANGKRRGMVLVLSGADGGVIREIAGAAEERNFGWAICDVHDTVAGSSHALVVSSPYTVDWPPDDVGLGTQMTPDRVWLLPWGRTARVAVSHIECGGLQNFDDLGHVFGAGLVALTDIDRDGVEDAVVASHETYIHDTVCVFCISGSTGAFLWERQL